MKSCFSRGSVGIGTIWSCAGLGLVIGGVFAHWLGPKLSFRSVQAHDLDLLSDPRRDVCHVQSDAAFWAALVFIALSRAAVAVSSVLNMTQFC